MYNDIGGKIKGIAVISAIIAVSGCCVTGVVLMAVDENLMALGLLVMLIGSFMAWVSSWLLYGIGQLIENSDLIAEPYRKRCDKREIYEKQLTKRAEGTPLEYNMEDVEFIDTKCPRCQAVLSYTKEQIRSNKKLTCPECDAHLFFK